MSNNRMIFSILIFGLGIASLITVISIQPIPKNGEEVSNLIPPAPSESREEEIFSHTQIMEQLPSGAWSPVEDAFLPFYSSIENGIATDEYQIEVPMYNEPGVTQSGGSALFMNQVLVTEEELKEWLVVDSLYYVGKSKVFYSKDAFDTTKYNYCAKIEGTWYMTGTRGTFSYGVFEYENVIGNLVYWSDNSLVIPR